MSDDIRPESDEATQAAAPESAVAAETADEQGWREAERRRIQRTRRTLVIVLTVLVILLLSASYALLQIFKPAGKIATTQEANGIKWIRSIYGWGPGVNQQFTGPQGVAIGPDGTIWATTQGQHRVVGFNPDGTLASMLYQGEPGKAGFPNAFAYPVAVAVDPAGLIYVADQVKSTIWVCTRDNQVVRSIFVPTPASVAVSSDRLVVGSASGFVLMSPTGDVIKVIGTQGTSESQFQAVRGAVIGKDGTIYITDQYNNRVSAYDKNGDRKWMVATGARGNQKAVKSSTQATKNTAPANMQIPAGLTMDAAGRLVIADPFGFDVTALKSTDGTPTAKYGAPGTIDGKFVYPSSVAYDPARDWFAIADTGNERIQIVRIPDSGGSGTSVVSRALAGPLRACLIPLLLIILTIVGSLIYRAWRRYRDRKSREARQESAAAKTNVTAS